MVGKEISTHRALLYARHYCPSESLKGRVECELARLSCFQPKEPLVPVETRLRQTPKKALLLVLSINLQRRYYHPRCPGEGTAALRSGRDGSEVVEPKHMPRWAPCSATRAPRLSVGDSIPFFMVSCKGRN